VKLLVGPQNPKAQLLPGRLDAILVDVVELWRKRHQHEDQLGVFFNFTRKGALSTYLETKGDKHGLVSPIALLVTTAI